MLKFKRAAALFVALCLLACGAFGAAAEQAEKVDVIADLLNYFLGVDEPEEETQPNESAESYADPEDYVEGEEEYVFDSYDKGVVTLKANPYYFEGEPVTKVLLMQEGVDSDYVPGIITGTYAVAVQGVTFANVELKDFDMTDKDAISGTVTLKPTDEVIAAAFGDASALPVKDIALEVKLDTTKDQQDIEVKLVGDGAMIVGLALKAANRTPTAVQAPTNTVDMTDSDALMAWVSGLDFDSVLDNLTKAGVPEELVTALQSLIPAM